MRRTWWYVLFEKRDPQDPERQIDGQPIFVHGGRRAKAVHRAAAAMARDKMGPGWRLAAAHRCNYRV